MTRNEGPRPGDSIPEGEWNYHESRELTPDASLEDTITFLDGLTEERNEKYLGSTDVRIKHLVTGGAEMLETLMRLEGEALKDVLPQVAAKVALQIFTVAHAVGGRTAFINALAEKYPERCAYCGNMPCTCATNRSEEMRGTVSDADAQTTWTFAQWQEHLKEMYGKANDAREPLWLAGRLVLETKEVLEAGMQPEENDADVRSELADCFAWLVAVANRYDIDLGATLAARYKGGCPNCGNYPCTCGPFTRRQDRKSKKLGA